MRTPPPRVVVTVVAAVLAGPGIGAQSPTPSLQAVLERAAVYAESYEERFSVLVADEVYEQTTRANVAVMVGGNLTRGNPGGGMGQGGDSDRRRVLKSDYLLVRLENGGWMPFRDVYEVDGQRVRDREARLLKLFSQPENSSFEQAEGIMADSNRYNLGQVRRTINIPTLAVLLAQQKLQSRFSFTREAADSADPKAPWVVGFRERTRPTLIKTSNGKDLLLTGRLWIDPANGTIVKTALTAADPLIRATVSVDFIEDPSLELWVPQRMEDIYLTARNLEEVRCVATYTWYRRLSIETKEPLRKPRG